MSKRYFWRMEQHDRPEPLWSKAASHFEDLWPAYAMLLLVLILGLILGLGISSANRKEEELHQRYMNICTKDMKKADPYMETAEAEERCEVQWLMAERSQQESSTTVIPIVMPR